MPRARSDRESASVSGRGARGVPGDENYWRLSMRPLHVLAFLSPLIILYEIGSIQHLARLPEGVDVSARRLLRVFFEQFGAFSLHLPGIALAVVLLLWHVLERDRWRLSWRVLAGMFAESIVWTFPLLVLGLLFSHHATRGLLQSDGSGVEALSWQARLTLSIGAGIYEELVFRLIAVAIVHFLLVDVARVPERVGWMAAALISSAAFAFYHDVWTPTGLNVGLAAYCLLAGLYLCGVFITRGFGLVVAVHAWYDVVALVLIPTGLSVGER
jgi:Type II CAAX prenyl endopeptidase Rce1-like